MIDELEFSGCCVDVNQAFIGTVQKERGGKRDFHLLLVKLSVLHLLQCLQMLRTEAI